MAKFVGSLLLILLVAQGLALARGLTVLPGGEAFAAFMIEIVEDFNANLTDIIPQDVDTVSRKLGIVNNGPTTTNASYPVSGIMYGEQGTVFIPLVLKHNGVSITSLFVYDTASPFVYLSYATAETLGLTPEDLAGATEIDVHGSPTTLHQSGCQFGDYNILGYSFFRDLDIEVRINYKKGVAVFAQAEAFDFAPRGTAFTSIAPKSESVAAKPSPPSPR